MPGYRDIVFVSLCICLCVRVEKNWAAKVTGFTLEIEEKLPVDSDQDVEFWE